MSRLDQNVIVDSNSFDIGFEFAEAGNSAIAMPVPILSAAAAKFRQFN